MEIISTGNNTMIGRATKM